MWVADSIDGKIYAYRTSDQTRDDDKDFDTLDAAGNTSPGGIWSDGDTMWITDRADEKIYAYRTSNKSHDDDKDFDTLDAAGNTDPYGIWSDGATMWVADATDEKIYAYNTDGTRDNTRDFDTLSGAATPSPSASGPTGRPCGPPIQSTARAIPTTCPRRPRAATTPRSAG